ncbi:MULTISPECIES: FeoB-associated Cys-rich membrane protein [Caproicibacterium]|uniref:FeoB-associated Cys-rich membrane protein n=1 Tax=Caproicibacterium argilliputei TaxID=3030016 RepID=A0AA97H4D7_9FIRM|nr:FeoB-associated Cys-rich membrane protein [Caproicibacterium argilliputei]WOC33303.1 FeoB-associated Cys-rich membrane protein [Caproicibacterium argilliputei]
MQVQDWILLGILTVLVVLAGRYWWKHRHNCCGNCAGCSHCEACRSSRKKQS